MKSISGWRKRAKKFLPSYSIKKLNKLFEKEKDPKLKLKIKTAILRKKGKTLTEISKEISKTVSTTEVWLKEIEKNKFDFYGEHKKTKKRGKLSEKMLKELNETISNSPREVNFPFMFWTNRLVQLFICKRFKIRYKIRNIEYIVKSLGFELEKPKRKCPKYSMIEQRKFIKKIKQEYQIPLTKDFRTPILVKKDK